MRDKPKGTRWVLSKGNMEVARIHAENAIRQKNQVSPAVGEG